MGLVNGAASPVLIAFNPCRPQSLVMVMMMIHEIRAQPLKLLQQITRRGCSSIYGQSEVRYRSSQFLGWHHLTCVRAVYIGGAASISFLHVIRRLVSQQIGPSPFSHNDKNDRMLEMESPQAVMTSELEMDDTRLTAEQKQNYLRCYYAVVWQPSSFW